MWPLVLAMLFLGPAPAVPARAVAITLDDLPGTGARSLAELVTMNKRVLAALGAARAPAIGFVNESGLQVPGERDPRVAILQAWLDAGMTLGNHGYAHRDLSRIPPLEYEDDVLRGEVITRRLLRDRGLPLVYYRHPYTHTGPTAEIKQAFERFLAARKYEIAPFTIEHSDWMFASVYTDALDRGDERLAAAVRAAYLAYLERMCTWFETLARDTFGREIPQILLTHVNRLNAQALPEVLAVFRKRGYRFITIDQALSDVAYRTPDSFVGRNGPSWLHRWRVSKNLPSRQREEPDPPADIIARWKQHQPPPPPEPAARPAIPRGADMR
jgi:peptidoglycan/xylan/chitin deacetylase (PgdA/CDA1 family)